MPTANTRTHIIETASELFYRNGYNRTGINEIIAEAGIAKATLYSHFRSKQEICLAYLERKHNTLSHDIAEFCAARPKGIEQALAVFDYLHEFFSGRDFNGCWCLKTIAEIPKDEETIRNEIQRQKQELLSFMQELVANNLPGRSEEQQAIVGRQLYLLYESAVAESHLHQEAWPIDSAREMAAHLLV